jgi:hypothetical protein
MTRDELFILLAKLRDEHGEAFEKWYDNANYPDIKHYCETGFLIERFFEGSTAL